MERRRVISGSLLKISDGTEAPRLDTTFSPNKVNRIAAPRVLGTQKAIMRVEKNIISEEPRTFSFRKLVSEETPSPRLFGSRRLAVLVAHLR